MESTPFPGEASAAQPTRRRLFWLIGGIALLVVIGAIVYRSMTFITQPQQRRGRFMDSGLTPVGVTRIHRGDIRLTLRALGRGYGVAIGAYFPQVSLSALGGYAGDPLSQLFKIGNRIWSLGATANDTLYDFGDRAGSVMNARATYDQYVAAYRQTVLSSFQQVEDELLAIRVLQQEASFQDQAVKSAQTAADVALNEFNSGTVAYTTVITAIQTLLADQQAQLTIQQNQLVASVTLIEALGGGWDTSQL